MSFHVGRLEAHSTYATSNYRQRITYRYEEQLTGYCQEPYLNVRLEEPIIVEPPTLLPPTPSPYIHRYTLSPPTLLKVSKEAEFIIKGTLTWIFFELCELIYSEYLKGAPIMNVKVERILDPETEWEELVFIIQVNLKFDKAMEFWDGLAEKVDRLKRALPEEMSKMLDEKVAFHIEWDEQSL